MDRIYIVTEDRELIVGITAGLVELEDHELVMRSEVDGAGGQNLAEDPELFLLDMRCQTGKTVFERLRSGNTWSDVPRIALGEFREARSWAPLLDQGASDYLDLSFSAAEITAKVKNQLRLKKRIDQLKEEAVIDELTGIYNRRFMESQLVSKLGEARRYHHPFSLMILDLDHFKKVNDTLGHQFGDFVLREGAGLMRSLVRKEDVVARYGGEEFALLLPHTDRTGSSVLGERVRGAIAQNDFVQGEKQRQITVSIGVATYPLDPMESVEELIECADQRLYRAKEEGRNRVIAA